MGGNLKVPFKAFLKEGGNVQVGGVQADQIRASKVERTAIVKEVISNLLILSSQFEQKFGRKIWKDDSYVTSGSVFSGSSKHFVDLGISDELYGANKPNTGDIDVQVDESIEDSLHEFFKTNTKFGTMEYLGQSESAIGQISGLFKFKNFNINVQIDFEFTEVDEKGKPTEWSKFSRSSAWEDIEQGIKGFAHKWALACLDHVFTAKIKIKKGKRNPKIETKEVHFFAFSVMKGLRPKFRLVDGETDVWEDIPSKEGNYQTDISEIFTTLFKKKPNKADRDMFDSFVGIIGLVNRYFDKKQQKKFVDAFVEFMFGRNGQKIYRGRPDMDAQVKHAAMDYIEKKLKIKKSNYSSIIDTYYENY